MFCTWKVPSDFINHGCGPPLPRRELAACSSRQWKVMVATFPVSILLAKVWGCLRLSVCVHRWGRVRAVDTYMVLISCMSSCFLSGIPLWRFTGSDAYKLCKSFHQSYASISPSRRFFGRGPVQSVTSHIHVPSGRSSILRHTATKSCVTGGACVMAGVHWEHDLNGAIHSLSPFWNDLRFFSRTDRKVTELVVDSAYR